MPAPPTWLPSPPVNGDEVNGEVGDDDAASEEALTRARRIASVLFGNVKFQVSPAPFLIFFVDKRGVRPWKHGLRQFFDVAFCSAAKSVH